MSRTNVLKVRKKNEQFSQDTFWFKVSRRMPICQNLVTGNKKGAKRSLESRWRNKWGGRHHEKKNLIKHSPRARCRLQNEQNQFWKWSPFSLEWWALFVSGWYIVIQYEYGWRYYDHWHVFDESVLIESTIFQITHCAKIWLQVGDIVRLIESHWRRKTYSY